MEQQEAAILKEKSEYEGSFPSPTHCKQVAITLSQEAFLQYMN